MPFRYAMSRLAHRSETALLLYTWLCRLDTRLTEALLIAGALVRGGFLLFPGSHFGDGIGSNLAMYRYMHFWSESTWGALWYGIATFHLLFWVGGLPIFGQKIHWRRSTVSLTGRYLCLWAQMLLSGAVAYLQFMGAPLFLAWTWYAGNATLALICKFHLSAALDAEWRQHRLSKEMNCTYQQVNDAWQQETTKLQKAVRAAG